MQKYIKVETYKSRKGNEGNQGNQNKSEQSVISKPIRPNQWGNLIQSGQSKTIGAI